MITLVGIFALRMFGLFLLLPVLALHAGEFAGATPYLTGLALGVYGLTQAILQIPFGMMSDRIGRKQVITLGLVIFALGSIVAALASTIEWVIIGRAIQGGGAVSSAVLALTADLTREEQRTKAMAMIGMGIGMVFLLSMGLAPPLSGWIGVQGLFLLTAVLAILAILLLHLRVPTPINRPLHRDVLPVWGQMHQVLRNAQLLRLDFGIFVLHMVLTALFVILPGQLLLGKLDVSEHWKVYLPVLILSVAAIAPIIRGSARTDQANLIFRVATLLLAVALMMLGVFSAAGAYGFYGLLFSLWLFFVAFNGLEAILPSLVSRVAPAAGKGTAIGVYNSLQFFGVFVGGLAGGFVAGRYGPEGVFALCAALALIWGMVAWCSPSFNLATSRVISITPKGQSLPAQPHFDVDAFIDRIRDVRGVQEVTFVHGETFAYLKVDETELDTATLNQLTT